MKNLTLFLVVCLMLFSCSSNSGEEGEGAGGANQEAVGDSLDKKVNDIFDELEEKSNTPFENRDACMEYFDLTDFLGTTCGFKAPFAEIGFGLCRLEETSSTIMLFYKDEKTPMDDRLKIQVSQRFKTKPSKYNTEAAQKDRTKKSFDTMRNSRAKYGTLTDVPGLGWSAYTIESISDSRFKKSKLSLYVINDFWEYQIEYEHKPGPETCHDLEMLKALYAELEKGVATLLAARAE